MTSRFFRIAAVATAFSAVIIARAQDPPKCHVPANECERSIRQMLSGRRYLGLDIVEIKPGLVIKAVHPDSPASRADFQDGDRLIAVNGKSMDRATARMFKETLAEARQTGRLWIIVLRRGAYRKIEARLEPYPREYVDKVVSGHLAQAHGVATSAGGQK